MKIDWFTFVAQLINFAILVWLLKRFLYGPIIQAIDNREQAIAEQIRTAEQIKAEAQATQVTFESRLADLDAEAERLRATAQREVSRWTQEHMVKAREQVEASQQEWTRAINRERESIVTALQLDAARHTFQVARQLTAKLADVRLEQLVVDRFLTELSAANAFIAAPEGCSVLVESTFELGPEARDRMASVLMDSGCRGEVEFRVNPDILSGIEVQYPDARIAWSFRDSLAALESELIDSVDRTLPMPADQLINSEVSA